MANSGRYALKTVVMDSISGRREGAPGLVMIATSSNTSAASSTKTPSGNAGSSGARTTLTPSERSAASYRSWSAIALATLMGSRGRWVSSHSASLGLTARVTAMSTRSTAPRPGGEMLRSEEHTSELQSRLHLVCRLLLEKQKLRTEGGVEWWRSPSPQWTNMLEILTRRYAKSG